ncbi:MAG: FTR1 family protein [Candidatus Bathyarchaeia archaeon]
MIGQFLLASREGLEAAPITAMVLAYLRRTKRSALSRYIWYGIYVAVAASLIFGVSIWLIYGGLAESAKAVFEGVARAQQS